MTMLLEQGAFAGLGPIRFRDGARFDDAERAVRVLLADVDHCVWMSSVEHEPITFERWWELAEDLHRCKLLAEGRAFG
jgi:hypothetical protein